MRSARAADLPPGYASTAMKLSLWLGAVTLAIAAAARGAACGGMDSVTPGKGAGGGAAESSVASCVPCEKDADCGGEVCAQFTSGSFCAPSCETQAQCTGNTTCVPNQGSTGSGVGVCVVPTGACGASQGTRPRVDGGSDAGMPAPAVCSQFASPDQSATCTCPSGRTCQTNGCRYNEWCNTSSMVCSPPPLGCGGTAGTPYDAGAPPSGSVAADGGQVSRLLFAVVGDTRPANEDDTSGYPTAIITKLFGDMQAMQPRPSFAVATGDYQYASPTGTQSAPQLELYLGARAQYSNVLFATMGNHECTGLTSSNCGPTGADGNTTNYTNFLQMFLGPIGQTLPYYEIDVAAPDGSWTSKFLFVAANAWTQTQANWLDAAMARATTYTFLIRHEPAASSSALGVNPAENIMMNHPYTLSLVGHDHTYSHATGSREVTIGNGGAPLGGSTNYGFGMIGQQSDGTLAVDMIDLDTGLADPTFHFAVKPDGTAL